MAQIMQAEQSRPSVYLTDGRTSVWGLRYPTIGRKQGTRPTPSDRYARLGHLLLLPGI